MRTRKLIISIDGPAGSGKSTTARIVAERLGLLHIDTGAMYRAVTVKVLEEEVRPGDQDAISKLLDSTNVELRQVGPVQRVFLDGRDVTERIRDSDVTAAVSAVSRVRRVREAMVRQQRALGAARGVVMDGRDIGTVVFPDADLKIFLVASLNTRAERRREELLRGGVDAPVETLKSEIARRDGLDSSRHESPLKRAPDAIELDTSHMTINEQVELVVKKAKEILEWPNHS
jgi:cytidylate kinase